MLSVATEMRSILRLSLSPSPASLLLALVISLRPHSRAVSLRLFLLHPFLAVSLAMASKRRPNSEKSNSLPPSFQIISRSVERDFRGNLLENNSRIRSVGSKSLEKFPISTRRYSPSVAFHPLSAPPPVTSLSWDAILPSDNQGLPLSFLSTASLFQPSPRREGEEDPSRLSILFLSPFLCPR